MEKLNLFLKLIKFPLDFIYTMDFFIIIILLIIIYHSLLYLFRDRKYIKAYRKYKDPENLLIDDLTYLPIVNIIVPAWKEGELFRQCLLSITKLSYPKIRVIVNAGGNEETLKIANYFKKYDNFLILYQKGGKSRPSMGKIRALNECLSSVFEGILYMVDADVYITDEILIRMLYPIVNHNEDVVIGGIRPLKSQEDKDLVKYLQINRNLTFRYKFLRYNNRQISGANTMLKIEVIKFIGKFSENKIWGEDTSRGKDILSKGYKIFNLIDYRGRIYSQYPDTINTWVKQKIRWNENFIFYSYQHRKRNLLNVFFLFLLSLFLLFFPILAILHIGFIFIGFYLLLSIYLKKMRRLIFFKLTIDKIYLKKFKIIFFIKIIFYIYIETLIYIYVFLHSIFSYKKLKKEKILT